MTPTNTIPFIAGNWKMHMTISESLDLVTPFVESSEKFTDSEVVVIPPFTALHEVIKMTSDSSLRVGAQNLFWEEKGAFTGEISPSMLKDIGCTYVVIGHSERRQYFGETNQTVNKKIKSALACGLIPIMCFGESLEEREKGEMTAKVESQIVQGVQDLSSDDFKRIILAYEPIWAIGTGLTATPDQAQEVHAFIRAKLEEIYGNDSADCAIILYGGSVKPANTFSLLSEKDINGALVGGASLQSDSFISIIKEAIKANKEKN